MAEILHKTRIDTENRVLVALGLYNVADGQRSDVTAVLEIPRVERFQANLVEDLASFGPLGKNPRGSHWGCVANVFVLVVFLGSPDDSVLNHVLYHLGDFILGKWNVHDETHAVLGGILFAGEKWQCGEGGHQDYDDSPQHEPISGQERPSAYGDVCKITKNFPWPRVSTIAWECQLRAFLTL